MAGLIVGIDPGAMTAVCILDLSGNLKSVRSQKNFSQGLVRSHISAFGEPIIVAVDVQSPSKVVEKIAQSFGAKIFCPEQNVDTREKDRLYNRYLEKGGEVLRNQHEKDALVAALLAFYAQQNKMRNIERKFGAGSDEVKKAVIQGKKVSDVMRKR